MKFKITITGLLSAILITCIFTAYELTTEAKKQTELQLAQAEGTLALIEMQKDVRWTKDYNGEWQPALYSVQYDEEKGYYDYIYNADGHYLNAQERINKIDELD